MSIEAGWVIKLLWIILIMAMLVRELSSVSKNLSLLYSQVPNKQGKVFVNRWGSRKIFQNVTKGGQRKYPNTNPIFAYHSPKLVFLSEV